MTVTHLNARSAEKEALGTLRVVQPTMPNGHRRRPYGETTSIKLPARAITILRGFVDDLHAGEIILEFRRVKANLQDPGKEAKIREKYTNLVERGVDVVCELCNGDEKVVVRSRMW